MSSSPLPPTARAAVALLRANLLYWPTVAPEVRSALARWESQARSIPEPRLRSIALRKLRDERFNAEVAATLATLAPHRRRALVVEAIVALQVAYDYLDLLTEQPARGGAGDFAPLLEALVDAVKPDARHLASDYGGYLGELVETVKRCLGALPGADSVLPVAACSAERCVHAQALSHAAAQAGLPDGAQPAAAQTAPWRWASCESDGTGLGATELLAGACASVLCLHALIAAAADGALTPRDAQRLDALYLSIGALTMLDSLVDVEEDTSAGLQGYLSRYSSPEEMARRLAAIARGAVAEAAKLPHGGHHLLTIAGVVSYYASAPAASDPPASTVMRPLGSELRSLIAPTLWTMRTWRAAKRPELVSSVALSGPLRHVSRRVRAVSSGRRRGVGLGAWQEGKR